MSQKKDKEKILFFRTSVFKVAELIFNSPNKIFHIRKLAEEAGLSTTATLAAVTELQKFKISSIEKTDVTTNIRADLESEAYRFYKKVFNLYRLERYGIIDILKDRFSAHALVLFGSFARGEDIEESDIDFLIITKNRTADVDEYLVGWERFFKRKINIHILPSLEDSSKEFKNAVANGIVLHGYLKVIS